MTAEVIASPLWPWVVLLLLGAVHGVNPGMGWLFAVALGLQRGERRAVWGALLPLAAGHALSVAAAVGLAVALGVVVPAAQVRWLVVVALAALGARQLWRHAHPRFGGMRIGARDLAVWSFLVATAHGAGLMAVPFAADAGAVRAPAEAWAAQPPNAMRAMHPMPEMHGIHAAHAAPAAPGLVALGATLAHTAAYLLVTGLLAVIVYERVGLRVLRRAWLNLDRLWAIALLLTAAAVALV